MAARRPGRDGDVLPSVLFGQGGQAQSCLLGIPGFPAEEHIRDVEQSTDFLGVHPGDAGMLRQKIQQAILCNGTMHYTYHVFNDRKGEYCWIRLDGSVKEKEDGTKLLYGIYSDVSDLERSSSRSLSVMSTMYSICAGRSAQSTILPLSS